MKVMITLTRPEILECLLEGVERRRHALSISALSHGERETVIENQLGPLGEKAVSKFTGTKWTGKGFRTGGGVKAPFDVAPNIEVRTRSVAWDDTAVFNDAEDRYKFPDSPWVIVVVRNPMTYRIDGQFCIYGWLYPTDDALHWKEKPIPKFYIRLKDLRSPQSLLDLLFSSSADRAGNG